MNVSEVIKAFNDLAEKLKEYEKENGRTIFIVDDDVVDTIQNQLNEIALSNVAMNHFTARKFVWKKG